MKVSHKHVSGRANRMDPACSYDVFVGDKVNTPSNYGNHPVHGPVVAISRASGTLYGPVATYGKMWCGVPAPDAVDSAKDVTASLGVPTRVEDDS